MAAIHRIAKNVGVLFIAQVIIYVLGFFITGSATFWAYIVLWIVVPENPVI